MFALLFQIPTQMPLKNLAFTIVRSAYIKISYLIQVTKDVLIIVLETGVIIQQDMDFVWLFVLKILLYLEMLFRDLEYVFRFVVMDYLEIKTQLEGGSVYLHVQMVTLHKQIH